MPLVRFSGYFPNTTGLYDQVGELTTETAASMVKIVEMEWDDPSVVGFSVPAEQPHPGTGKKIYVFIEALRHTDRRGSDVLTKLAEAVRAVVVAHVMKYCIDQCDYVCVSARTVIGTASATWTRIGHGELLGSEFEAG